MIEVKILKLDPRANVPEYMSMGAAGCDIQACLDGPVEVCVKQRAAIPTGLAFEIPAGYEIQVRPRSGLAYKQGLTVVNAPGTIDSDYRGEVKVLVVNLGEHPVTVAKLKGTDCLLNGEVWGFVNSVLMSRKDI